MEFIDKFVIPQSLEHIELLHFLASLVLFIFVPFISVVFGGTLLSLFYGSKGRKSNDNKLVYFSKDLVELFTVNKNVGIVLGIIPVLTIMVIYAQLLHSASNLAVTYIFIAFILMTIALILIYTYRYSMSFNFIFDSLDGFKPKDYKITTEINILSSSTKKLSSSTGYYGLIILFFSIWFYLSGLHLSLFPQAVEGKGVFQILFSFDVISRLLFFVTFSLTITGAAILFRYFFWEGGIKGLEKEYLVLVKRVGIKTAFYYSALLPLLLVLNLKSLPEFSLSTSVFVYSGLLVFGLFVAYNLLYSMTRNDKSRLSGALFIVIIISMCFSLAKDQIAMNNSTKLQALKLSEKYNVMMASLMGETTKAPEIIGEDVYKVRCTPCHSFDHKIVGPPYNKTLPKYEGKMKDLVSFLLNPKKVDPNFPPMPNPGLKPAEAKAVAKYIIDTYKK